MPIYIQLLVVVILVLLAAVPVKWHPLERGAQNVVGEVQVEKNQSAGDVVNFSMESLLQFQNEHLIHKALAAGPSEPVRKRPSYDNRKRRFLAAQKPERRV